MIISWKQYVVTSEWLEKFNQAVAALRETEGFPGETTDGRIVRQAQIAAMESVVEELEEELEAWLKDHPLKEKSE